MSAVSSRQQLDRSRFPHWENIGAWRSFLGAHQRGWWRGGGEEEVTLVSSHALPPGQGRRKTRQEHSKGLGCWLVISETLQSPPASGEDNKLLLRNMISGHDFNWGPSLLLETSTNLHLTRLTNLMCSSSWILNHKALVMSRVQL